MVEVTVPRAWRVITNVLADAQVAGRMMTNPGLTDGARQEATRRYVRSADQLVTELGKLRQAGVLEAIAAFLDERHRD